MSRVSSPLVLGAAALVLVAGLVVGFRLLTASAETVDAGPTCETRDVAKGEPVTTNLVKVDVFNASSRAGLANRLSINLQRRGFLAGEVGNSRSEVEVKRVAILTTNPDDARAKLVAEQLKGRIEVAEPDVAVADDAVTVLVGDDFEGLQKKAPRKLAAHADFSVCLPTVTLE